jgi:hypothetical protein
MWFQMNEYSKSCYFDQGITIGGFFQRNAKLQYSIEIISPAEVASLVLGVRNLYNISSGKGFLQGKILIFLLNLLEKDGKLVIFYHRICFVIEFLKYFINW